MRFGSLNVRSAIRKAALIHDLIADRNLDVLALSETWIVDCDSDAVELDIAPPGYRIYNTCRPGATNHNRGGGLAFVHRESARVNVCRDLMKLEYNSFEFQVLEFRIGRFNLVFCNLYRPPTGPLCVFYDEFADFLGMLITKAGDRLLIAGDFNCPASADSLVETGLHEVLANFDLIQHISVPTRNESLLNLITTTSTSTRVNDIQVTESQIADHRLVMCSMDTTLSSPPVSSISYRDIKKIDLALFRSKLLSSSVFTTPASTTDEYVEQLEMNVLTVLDELAPMRTKKKRKVGKSNSWLSEDASRAKKQRCMLERTWMRTRKDSDQILYRRSCHHANRQFAPRLFQGSFEKCG